MFAEHDSGSELGNKMTLNHKQKQTSRSLSMSGVLNQWIFFLAKLQEKHCNTEDLWL